MILLGSEIDDFTVCCDFKDLRRIRLRAAFALRAAPPGAAFGENFACDGEALETFFHLVNLVGEPERRGSPKMELTLRQLAQLLDDPQESRDRRGLAGVDLGAEQFLRLLQTRDFQFQSPGSGAQAKANTEDPLVGTYKIGFWYDSESFADLRYDTAGLPLGNLASNQTPASHRGNYAFYAVADQMIWRGADADRNINVFVRPMFNLGILDARVRESRSRA